MADPRARRELELRLKFVADNTVGKRAMDEMAASAEKVERAMSKAQKAAMGVTGGGGGGGPRAGGAAGIGSGMGGAAGAGGAGGGLPPWAAAGRGLAEAIGSRFGLTPGLFKAAGIVGAGAHITQASKAIADAYQNPYLSAFDRDRASFRAIVPFGETIQSYADTFSGRAAAMREVGVEGRIAGAESQARLGVAATRAGLEGDSAAARARADYLNRTPALAAPTTDRTTADGERRYRLEVQRTALAERGSAAEQERAESLARETAAQRELDRLEGRRDNNSARIATLETERRLSERGARHWWEPPEARYSGGPNPTARGTRGDPAVINARRLEEEGVLRAENARLPDEIVRQQQIVAEQARRRLAAEGRAAVARGPERLRLEASDLEDRAGRALSAADRIGSAGRDNTEDALYSLREVLSRGVDNVDPSELAAARAFAPETVSRLTREAGRRNPLYDSFRALAPDDYPDDPAADLFRRAADARTRAGADERDIERGVAEDSARIAEAMSQAIISTLNAALPEIRRQIILELQRSAAGARGV